MVLGCLSKQGCLVQVGVLLAAYQKGWRECIDNVLKVAGCTPIGILKGLVRGAHCTTTTVPEDDDQGSFGLGCCELKTPEDSGGGVVACDSRYHQVAEPCVEDDFNGDT